MKNCSVLVLMGAIGGLCAASAALAKLPPPTAQAKAAAAAAAPKTAWSDKVAVFQLCKAQDKVVAHYQSSARSAGKEPKAATPTPTCADPGLFVAAVEPVKPAEAAGAHSPAATAIGPPSSKLPAAEIAAPKKP